VHWAVPMTSFLTLPIGLRASLVPSCFGSSPSPFLPDFPFPLRRCHRQTPTIPFVVRCCPPPPLVEVSCLFNPSCKWHSFFSPLDPTRPSRWFEILACKEFLSTGPQLFIFPQFFIYTALDLVVVSGYSISFEFQLPRSSAFLLMVLL